MECHSDDGEVLRIVGGDLNLLDSVCPSVCLSVCPSTCVLHDKGEEACVTTEHLW